MLTISAVPPSGEQIQQHPYPGTESREIKEFQLLMPPTDNNPYCSEGTLGSSIVLDRPEKITCVSSASCRKSRKHASLNICISEVWRQYTRSVDLWLDPVELFTTKLQTLKLS